MSRIGKKPIAIPSGIKVEIKDGSVEVSGPKGKLSRRIPLGIGVKFDAPWVQVERRGDEKESRALHGLTRALIANMVLGVTEGFSKSLDIVGIGYKAELIGKGGIKGWMLLQDGCIIFGKATLAAFFQREILLKKTTSLIRFGQWKSQQKAGALSRCTFCFDGTLVCFHHGFYIT